jgi:hypothetical protein
MTEKLCTTCIHEDLTAADVPCNKCLNYANWTAKTQSARGPALGALDVQVAGGHYKGKKIQPVEYIHANKLNFLEGCIVKRITRWRDKPAKSRFEDLEKIKHEIDLLIEMETKHG